MVDLVDGRHTTIRVYLKRDAGAQSPFTPWSFGDIEVVENGQTLIGGRATGTAHYGPPWDRAVESQTLNFSFVLPPSSAAIRNLTVRVCAYHNIVTHICEIYSQTFPFVYSQEFHSIGLPINYNGNLPNAGRISDGQANKMAWALWPIPHESSDYSVVNPVDWGPVASQLLSDGELELGDHHWDAVAAQFGGAFVSDCRVEFVNGRVRVYLKDNPDTPELFRGNLACGIEQRVPISEAIRRNPKISVQATIDALLGTGRDLSPALEWASLSGINNGVVDRWANIVNFDEPSYPFLNATADRMKPYMYFRVYCGPEGNNLVLGATCGEGEDNALVIDSLEISTKWHYAFAQQMVEDYYDSMPKRSGFNHLVGWFPDIEQITSRDLGIGGTPLGKPFSWMTAIQSADLIFGHELVHSFGLIDGQVSSTDEFGWDVLGYASSHHAQKPPTLVDVASWNTGTTRDQGWINPSVYEQGLDQIASGSQPQSIQPSESIAFSVADSQNVLIHKSLLSSSPSSSTVAGGLYRAQFMDGAENVLCDFPFDSNSVLITERFQFRCPSMSAVQGVRVTRGAAQVASISRSSSHPAITVLQPLPGATVGPGTNVQWSATDADGDDVQVSIYYNPDGTGWIPIEIRGPESGSLALPQDISRCMSCQLLAFATDGLNTSQHVISSLSSLAQHTPRVTILSPVSGAVYKQGEPVILTAHGYDVDVMDNETLLYSWQSNVDGLISTRAVDTIVGPNNRNIMSGLPLFSVGAHTIQLDVTDSAGYSGVATVSISVAP
ncbi:MAG: hypothetical protein ACH37Z_02205 [Anaerolineae bacterium]